MSETEPQSPEQKPSKPAEQTPEASALETPELAAPETPKTAAPELAAPATPDAPPAPAEPLTAVAPVEVGGAEAPAAETPEPAPQAAAGPPVGQGLHWGTGRRKSAIARVRLVPGDGKVLINHRELDTYFTELKHRMAVTAPLEATGKRGMWSVLVNVRGGGPSGQSDAIKLGVARALVAADESTEPTLRDTGLLTRDARRVERKKYGRRKARRGFQFSKR